MLTIVYCSEKMFRRMVVIRLQGHAKFPQFVYRLYYDNNNNLLLSILSAIPGNITSSLPDFVYECVS